MADAQRLAERRRLLGANDLAALKAELHRAVEVAPPPPLEKRIAPFSIYGGTSILQPQNNRSLHLHFQISTFFIFKFATPARTARHGDSHSRRGGSKVSYPIAQPLPAKRRSFSYMSLQTHGGVFRGHPPPPPTPLYLPFSSKISGFLVGSHPIITPRGRVGVSPSNGSLRFLLIGLHLWFGR